MSQQQISAKKQQGTVALDESWWMTPLLIPVTELQVQYSNYKETLQAIAQKIGDIEQEVEEHK